MVTDLEKELDIFVPAGTINAALPVITTITGSCPCNTNNNCTFGFCTTFTCSGVPIGCTGQG